MRSASLTWKERSGVNILARVTSYGNGCPRTGSLPCPPTQGTQYFFPFPLYYFLVLSHEWSQHSAA